MAKLYRRNGVYYYTITVNGVRERKSTGTADKQLAEDIAAKREWELRRSAVHGPDAVATFGVAMDLYLNARKDTRFLLPLLDRWDKTLLRDITPGEIQQAARELYPRASNATRNRQVITPARAVINHAADLGLCNHVRVKRFKEVKTERRAVDRLWIDAFMAAASPNLAALALFMFTTGARVGEAAALEWKTVNLQAAKATFPRTKTGDPHTVYLTPEVVALLANIRDFHPRKVFGFSGRHSVTIVWKRACERAGIDYVTPHQAGRHSFATQMIIREGVDLKTTARLGNWKSARLLLDTYVHPENEADIINQVFGGKKK